MSCFIDHLANHRSWDEWVPETRILKYNDENLKKQSDLKESYSVTKKKDAKKSDSTMPDKNKKRPRDALQEKVRDLFIYYLLANHSGRRVCQEA